MTSEQPRIYKHQLTADEFTFAFTATADEFALRADEMRSKGVERLTGVEVEEHYSIYAGWRSDEFVFTLVADAEVIAESNEPITFRGIPAPVPNLLLWHSKIPALTLVACTLAESEGGQIRKDATSFHFTNSTTGGFSIGQQSITGNFSIGQQSTTGNFTIWGQSMTGNFSISQSTTGDFAIWEKSTTGRFDISKHSTTGDFIIEDSEIGTLYIEKSTVDDYKFHKSKMSNLILSNSIIGHITIEKSIIGSISIRQQSTANGFHIEQTKIEGVSIWQYSKIGNFNVNDSDIGSFSGYNLCNSFRLVKANMAQFTLDNCRIPEFQIDSGCRIECYISNSFINLVNLRRTVLTKESVLSFLECQVYACLMEEFAVLGNLFFRQVSRLEQPFRWTELDDETVNDDKETDFMDSPQDLDAGYQQYHLSKLTGLNQFDLKITQPTLRITQSSLGKTEFTDCNLSSFKLEFNNAKIIETLISGGTVPQANVFIYKEQEGTLKWHEQKVSFYNQFKKIFDGQGDVYWATHFQAKTAEHQQRVLELRRQQENERFSTTFWDIITFRLNRWSNLHGESWGRALVFTLLAPLIFYLLFLLAGGRLFIPVNHNWQSIWNAIDGDFVGYYFTFLDPTHKIDFLKDKGVRLNGWSSFADFFGRVVVGYGIYQLISAFRKHGKK